MLASRCLPGTDLGALKDEALPGSSLNLILWNTSWEPQSLFPEHVKPLGKGTVLGWARGLKLLATAQAFKCMASKVKGALGLMACGSGLYG